MTRSGGTLPVAGAGDTITFNAVVQYLWLRRRLMLTVAAALFLVSLVAILVRAYMTVPAVRGAIEFSFDGASQHQFPTGRRFVAERLVDPGVVEKAIAAIGLDPTRFAATSVTDALQLLPQIPGAIEARWQRQDAEGRPREVFNPTRYALVIDLDSLNTSTKQALFHGIYRAYLEDVREQETIAFGEALSEISRVLTTAEFGSAVELVREQVRLLIEMGRVITESAYVDPVTRSHYRAMMQRLAALQDAQLTDLRALITLASVSRDRDMSRRRLQFRIMDLTQRIDTRRGEVSELMALLARVDRPVLVRPDALSAAAPRPDERGWDYYGRLVDRISTASADAVSLEVQRSAADRQLQLLQSAESTEEGIKLFEGRLKSTLDELSAIVREFDELHRNLVSEAIISRINVVEPPRAVGGPAVRTSVAIVLAAFGSTLLAMLLVGLADFLRRAVREAHA